MQYRLFHKNSSKTLSIPQMDFPFRFCYNKCIGRSLERFLSFFALLFPVGFAIIAPSKNHPGVAQLVARLLWEQDAAGSNPVTRTKFLGKTAVFGGFSALIVLI